VDTMTKVDTMTDEDGYPYKYAAEYIRQHYGPQEEQIAGSGELPARFVPERPKLSISQVDKILTGICRDADLNVREVACRLADIFLKAEK